MNATVTIGNEKKSLEHDYESWISEQIRNRRKAGESVKVMIEIDGDLDLRFTCEDKPSGGGGRSRNY
ncbi:MAG: hypothetical protein Q8K40_02625, partial [Ignavibacteria bacterium]|nr:hypothetical protein [Ignavibacteria bacterium]